MTKSTILNSQPKSAIIRTLYKYVILRSLFILIFCISSSVQAKTTYQQSADHLLHGETMAVAYSGFRAGQHPDRGNGAINPGDAEILEDLKILLSHNLDLIRLYDSGENSAATLKIIKQHKLPIKVLLAPPLHCPSLLSLSFLAAAPPSSRTSREWASAP